MECLPRSIPLVSRCGDDLLPIDPKAVATYLLDKDQKLSDGVMCMVNALSYLTSGPGGEWLERFPEKDFTSAQRDTVDHVCKMLEHLDRGGIACPKFEESSTCGANGGLSC